MLRVAQDDWRIEVCRDLDAVVNAWTASSDGLTTGVLHLGFDRPAASAFEAVASLLPGRMLFTAAAKYGVPGQFTTSQHAVGYVSKLPVYMALRGWGYTLEDDEVDIEPIPQQPDVSNYFSDWVLQFTEVCPEFASELRSANIKDEAAYLINEDQLSWKARYRSGLFRYARMIAGEEQDPCAIVRAAPPWIQSLALEHVDLTVRLANVFQRAGFSRVGDIARVTLDDLFAMQNFGRKCVADLNSVLLDALDKGPKNNGEQSVVLHDVDTGRTGSASLLSEIHRTLALCDSRQRDILERRMGFGRPSETLQALGEDYAITRERIRQIEAKAIKRIIRQENWDDLLTAKMERLLSDRQYPLPVLGLEAVDAWFAGISAEMEVLRYTLSNFCGNRVSIVNIGGVDYIGFLDQDGWIKAVSEADRILQYASGKGWEEQRITELLNPVLPEKAKEFRSLLWDEMSRKCHFSSDSDSIRTLVSYGRSVERAVEAVLFDADTPLHYHEIFLRLQQKTPETIDIRRVHSAAAGVGILLGRGVFGLEKHLNISSDDLMKISDEASSVILAASDTRQWHAAELLGDLIERGFSGSFDKYVVDYALKKASGLKRLGRMAWVRASATTSAAERLEVREAVLSLVVDAGRPLSTSEIRQRLVAMRGVNDVFQFSFSDPLIRLGVGVWGLNDRDVPIARADQPDLINHLISCLEQKGSGIHASEVGSYLLPVWKDVPQQIVFSLGVTDPKLRVSVGQFLYLAEWGGPRRETVFQIVQRLVDNTTGKFASEDIIRSLKAECTLAFDSSQVSACINSAGAVYDTTARLWCVDRSGSDI